MLLFICETISMQLQVAVKFSTHLKKRMRKNHSCLIAKNQTIYSQLENYLNALPLKIVSLLEQKKELSPWLKYTVMSNVSLHPGWLY